MTKYLVTIPGVGVYTQEDTQAYNALCAVMTRLGLRHSDYRATVKPKPRVRLTEAGTWVDTVTGEPVRLAA